jgi:Zn-dependent protease
VAVGLLPTSAALALSRLEPYGFLIVFCLLLTGILGSLIGPVIRIIVGLLGVFI